MNKTIKILLLITMLSLSLTANALTIRFGTEATYPPFEYVNKKGEITGFDIDIAKAICENLQAQCEFVTQSFNSLIPSLDLGKIDAAIAGIGVTPERKNQVAFSTSYYQPSASFIGLKTEIPDLMHSLKDKVIGVQEGSTFKRYMQIKYKKVVVLKSYGTIQDAFLDLRAERVDAIITDTPIARAWLNEGTNSKEFSLSEPAITDEEYFGSGYAIALSKKNTELLEQINQALAVIKENGKYAEIEKKYFGGSSG